MKHTHLFSWYHYWILTTWWTQTTFFGPHNRKNVSTKEIILRVDNIPPYLTITYGHQNSVPLGLALPWLAALLWWIVMTITQEKWHKLKAMLCVMTCVADWQTHLWPNFYRPTSNCELYCTQCYFESKSGDN